MTATIAAELTGASQLVKTDLGTLVLDGANSYTGGTAINGGVLEVAADASLGAAGGDLRFDAGTLRTTATFATDRGSDAGSGRRHDRDRGRHADQTGSDRRAGRADQDRAGTLVLTGTNSYGGGTEIDGGTVGRADANLGAAAGALGLRRRHASATASFAMDRDTTLDAGGGTIATGAGVTLAQAGDVAGAGALTKTGAGTLVLTGTGPRRRHDDRRRDAAARRRRHHGLARRGCRERRGWPSTARTPRLRWTDQGHRRGGAGGDGTTGGGGWGGVTRAGRGAVLAGANAYAGRRPSRRHALRRRRPVRGRGATTAGAARRSAAPARSAATSPSPTAPRWRRAGPGRSGDAVDRRRPLARGRRAARLQLRRRTTGGAAQRPDRGRRRPRARRHAQRHHDAGREFDTGIYRVISYGGTRPTTASRSAPSRRPTSSCRPRSPTRSTSSTPPA